MKTIIKNILPVTIAVMAFISCEKDIDHTVMTESTPPTISLSPAAVVLTSATSADTVEAISWSPSEYGFDAAVNYTVEIAKSGANFVGAQSVNTGSNRTLKYVGAVLNDLAIGQGITPGTAGTLDIRVKSSLSDAMHIYSPVSTLSVTTYIVEFPALLVRGGNSWVTPTTRTNGYVLTSPDFDGKYEGYLALPNADGWGGDAFKLLSTSSGIEYGWGTSSTTMAPGSTGNLWLTPAPNFMKVNADVNALTINYTPVNFFLAGDHNGWSTSATPMTYDPATKTVRATNVNFSAGNKFVFTANGGYDLSYKIDATGKLIYAGPPNWSGSNIPAPGAGTYTVILDLSGGNGNYTYTIQ
jgi:hypothetical protein